MTHSLEHCGIRNPGPIHWNLSAPHLYEHILRNGEGLLAEGGALVVSTVPHTGRRPSDKFIVDTPDCLDHIRWGTTNLPVSPDTFDRIHSRLLKHLEGKGLYVRDCFSGADPHCRLPIRIITELAWHSLLADSLFIPADHGMDACRLPGFTLIDAPSFLTDPDRDGTRSDVCILVNLMKRMILIGGTAYGGEIKKSVFTVMNYLLPLDRGILPMHCSANAGTGGDVALFFGLSGTGKTSLSADPNRFLIGDDQHGWSDDGIFNFEGGCYAKVINLSPEMEPEIHACTRRFGTVMENVVMDRGSRTPDLFDASLTENTRATYPIGFIPHSVSTGIGGHPRNIFMLTCDAFGVLPPVSRLTPEQAIYHFLSGYTAKIAGTEDGMGKEPQAVFSTCFGAPFLPLRPSVYANLFRERITRHGVGCWLVNTGWTGGGFGVGRRIRIDHTRAIIHAALSGELDAVPFVREPVFGLNLPTECPGVPTGILDPRAAWSDTGTYDETAHLLAARFRENFRQFEDIACADSLMAPP
jgi:phosphoenolpyruvate carboxykinase (ATP)